MQSFVLLTLIFFLSCSTSIKKSIPASSIESQILLHEIDLPFNETLVRKKINQFKQALKDGKLSEGEWKLHDELLNYYIQLKQEQKLRVKAHSSRQVEVESFCLNSSKAVPAPKEKFSWVRSKLEIPYYQELIQYSKAHSPARESIQTIIWNLGNKTYWENYPSNLQQILSKIDSNASVKLPSKLKESVKDAILDNIPIVSDLKDDLQLIQGEYYQYKDIRDQIQKLKSNYSLDDQDSLEEVEDSPLFAKTQSNGYKSQNITLYNPTESDQDIDLSGYHLEPKRKDVQRIGFGSRKNELQKNSLITDLEKVLFKDMLRLGIGFTPGINDVADIYELLIGKEFVSGESLGWQDRVLSGVGLIAGSGSGYRYAKRAVNAPIEYLPEFERGFEKTSGRSIDLKSIKTESHYLKDIEVTKGGIEKSPTLKNKFEGKDFKKTDFYVRENGDVIPSRGYKYVDSNSVELQTIKTEGRLPSRPADSPHYITFEKYSQSEMARSKLQLPQNPDGTFINDAKYRIDFDTLQTSDNLKIPHGEYGKADYLEPITSSYPNFGDGGAAQATYNNEIKVDRVINLKTQEIIFGQ